jgi:hypothetical protein
MATLRLKAALPSHRRTCNFGSDAQAHYNALMHYHARRERTERVREFMQRGTHARSMIGVFRMRGRKSL